LLELSNKGEKKGDRHEIEKLVLFNVVIIAQAATQHFFFCIYNNFDTWKKYCPQQLEKLALFILL